MSDFDQLRERWVKNAVDWITSAHISPSGDRVAITARGEVFVAPALQGRLVEATRNKLARHRNARFMPDGKIDPDALRRERRGGVLAGPGQRRRRGHAAEPRRVGPALGRLALARRQSHRPPRQEPAALDLRRAKKTQTKVADSADGEFDDLSWSPDSKWLAYAAPGPQPADADLPLRDCDGAHRAGDVGSVRQRQPGVEPGRQVALLPVGPQLRVARRQPLGLAPARAVLGSADEDLPRGPEARRALSLPAGR